VKKLVYKPYGLIKDEIKLLKFYNIFRILANKSLRITGKTRNIFRHVKEKSNKEYGYSMSSKSYVLICVSLTKPTNISSLTIY